MSIQSRVVVPALLCALASAQQPPSSSAPFVFDGRVPVHELAADPAFGAYGVWAAGRGYKVSFHDGMTFYPVLGASAPRNLPLRWETVAATAGGHDLIARGETAAHERSAWRYEYRYGALTEAYDVAQSGVEQTFVIAALPGSGDVVITGRWHSELQPHERAIFGTARTELSFCDAQGEAVIRYGEAFAVDAEGRRTDVRTELRGDEIRLVVPARFAADATLPITVDPFLTSTVLDRQLGATSGLIQDTDIGTESGASHNVLVAYSVPVSASDVDAYAVIADDDLSSPVVVFADLGTFSTVHPRVAYVRPAGSNGRWTIAVERATSSLSQIRVWLHDRGNTSFGSGSMMFLGLTASGTTDRKPDIGGSTTLSQALLVYQTDNTTTQANTSQTELHGVLVDANAKSFGNPFAIGSGPGPAYDRENAAVTQVSGQPSVDWVVVWQQRVFVGLATIVGQRISAIAPAGNTTVLLSDQQNDYVLPDVAGSDQRYALTALRASSANATTGDALVMTRFDWGSTSAQPVQTWTKTIVRSTSVPPTSFGELEMDIDADTDSHWTVVFGKTPPLIGTKSLEMIKVGFDGTTVETATLASPPATLAEPSVAYFSGARRFLCAYGLGSIGAPLYGRVLEYPSDALNVPYGTSCGGSFGAMDTPLLGSELWSATLEGALPHVSAVLLVGVGSAVFPLSLIGMAPCSLYLDPALVVSVPASTDAQGEAAINIPLSVSGDLYMQWFHIAPGANRLGLLATEGMRTQIR